MDQIHVKIGKNLARIRKSRGLSLDQMAEQTSVSKGMLAQIEKGTTNPTISTIWKIANGLRLSFTSLLQEEPSNVSIVHYRDIDPLVEEDGAFRSYPLFPYDVRTKIEMYVVEMETGCVHLSDAHNPGVEEYITIEEGCLDLQIAGDRYSLTAGQAIRFSADTPHTYMNMSDTRTRYLVTISYSI